MADQVKLETWQNAGNGRVWVWKMDRAGRRRDEVIPAGAKFQITSEDRLANSERAADENADVFRNGTLSPVRLIEGSEDAHELATNPNLMSEGEMRSLFDADLAAFKARINQVTNETALKRLQDLAESDTVDATLKQMKALNARLEELTPEPLRPPDTTGARTGGAKVGGDRAGEDRTSEAGRTMNPVTT